MIYMKIGILTFHFSDNYGALLQAYALRQWLVNQGVHAEFVNYTPDYVEGGGSFSQLWNPAKAKANAKVLYLLLSNLKTKWFGSEESEQAFMGFRRDRLGVNSKEIKDRDQLNRKSPKFDLLICGSDQIWNPSEQFGVDPVYFLDFNAHCQRRISYAASFGSGDLKPEFRDHVGKLLMGLDAISVREEQGVLLVKALAERDAKCVPDPTFLLDDYSHLISKPSETSGPYIFSYVLRSGAGFSEIASAISAEFGSMILSAHNPHRRWKKIGIECFGGPVEWISRLAYSEIVLTNSFHATVFSILLNRPFIAVRLPGKKAKLSGRLENLLEKVGLENRIVDAGDTSAAKLLAASEIDWVSVNQKVASLREVGRNFLREQLSIVETEG